MNLPLDQVVSLREQIKRRQQGLDNGKEVTSPSDSLRNVKVWSRDSSAISFRFPFKLSF